MTDITDAGPRLKAMNDALEENDRLRAEIARLQASIASLAAQRLRLTDAERYAIIAGLRCLERQLWADPENLGGDYRDMERDAATLRGLLNRLSPIKTAESDRPKPIATPEPADRLLLTDAERGLLDMLADHPVTHQIMPHEVATLRGLLDRTDTGEK